MKSIGTMIEQLAGMTGTNDLSDWETGFVESVAETAKVRGTAVLTSKQVEKVQDLYRRHFGD